MQIVHSTTAINPSFLSKGTYGKINLASESVGTPKVRLRAEVARLTVPTQSAVATGDTAEAAGVAA